MGNLLSVNVIHSWSTRDTTLMTLTIFRADDSTGDSPHSWTAEEMPSNKEFKRMFHFIPIYTTTYVSNWTYLLHYLDSALRPFERTTRQLGFLTA